MTEEESLHDFIIKEIKEKELVTASMLTKTLKEKGRTVHRLTLTGYLRAMCDLGILEEIPVPPANVFRIKNKGD